MSVAAPLLALENVSRAFGGIWAVKGLSMAVAAGSIHGVIGPNGSGKSTLFNLVSGVVAPTSGTIRFQGRRITGLTPHEVARRGVTRTFQAADVFDELTVSENLMVSAQCQAKTGFWRTLMATPRYRRGEAEARAAAGQVMAMLDLHPVADRVVGELAHRLRRAVALGNVLVTGATLIMLDELLAGLTTGESEEFVKSLDRLRNDGRTIVIVEHDIRTIMRLCDRITVLNHGEKIAEGRPEDVQLDAAVLEAYLGAE